MEDHRILNKIIIEQQLFKYNYLLLKKKKTCQKLFTNRIQRQHRLFYEFFQEKEKNIEQLFNEILQNQYLLTEKCKRIYLKLLKRKRKREKDFISKNKKQQIQMLINDIIDRVIQQSFQMESNDQILNIYYRSISSNNLHKKISFTEGETSNHIHKHNNNNKFSIINYSLTNNQWNFIKLEKIKRIHLRPFIN
jgi:hypothetical protein